MMNEDSIEIDKNNNLINQINLSLEQIQYIYKIKDDKNKLNEDEINIINKIENVNIPKDKNINNIIENNK